MINPERRSGKGHLAEIMRLEPEADLVTARRQVHGFAVKVEQRQLQGDGRRAVDWADLERVLLVA